MQLPQKLQSNFQNELREQVDAALSLVLVREPLTPTLSAAVRYMVLSGGKRVRPLLALSLAYDLGGDWQSLVEPALALELLHTSSLIHDDLPALDNDDYRRGQLSCHKKFSEAVAVLAGDVLIPLAFNQVVRARLSAAQKNLMTGVLSRAFIDLCAGQDLDSGMTQKIDRAMLVRLKTGALFSAAAQFGLIIAGSSDTTLSSAEEFGIVLGEYFQLIDDYLDVYGADDIRGRHESSDRRNHKSTPFTNRSGPASNENNVEQLISPALARLKKLLADLAQSSGQLNNSFLQTWSVIDGIRSRLGSSATKGQPDVA